MPVTIQKTRQIYESFVGPNRDRARGRLAFCNAFRHGLGLCDANGVDYRDKNGNRVLKESQFRAEDFSIKELALSMVGYGAMDHFNPNGVANDASMRSLLEAQYPGDSRALFEATGVGVDVSAFADVNAWTVASSGLLERKILEGFTDPTYIGDELCPVEPSRINEGQKVIGAARFGDVAEERQPGEPHKRTGFGERYVQLNKMRENGLAIDITKEVVFWDLTGQIYERAEGVGQRIAYRKEIDQIDAFIGVSTTSTGKYKFQYKGGNPDAVLTAYNFYSTSAQLGYTNSITNSLVDWTSLQTAWLQFVRMTDPEAKTRIAVMPNAMLVNPANLAVATQIISSMRTERRTAGSATQATAATLNIGETPGNPVSLFGMGGGKLLYSPLVEQRCTDADGLNLSQSNADIRWWLYQQGKPFKYYQAWPLTVYTVPGNQYDQIDRGIVSSTFANERGQPAAISPWHAIVNTN